MEGPFSLEESHWIRLSINFPSTEYSSCSGQPNPQVHESVPAIRREDQWDIGARGPGGLPGTETLIIGLLPCHAAQHPVCAHMQVPDAAAALL